MIKRVIFSTILVLSNLSMSMNQVKAIVGDQIITTLEIDNKKKEKPKLNDKEALQEIINEKMYLDYAKKNKIFASDALVLENINIAASQNNIAFKTFLESNEFKNSRRDIIEKITIKLVQQEILNKSKFDLNDDEIFTYMKSQNIEKKIAKQIKFLQIAKSISEVDASIESKQSDIYALFHKIKQKSTNNHNYFSSIATTISDDKSFTVLYDSKWIDLNDLPSTLAIKVGNLKIGEISEPFYFQNALRIVLVLDRRDFDKSYDLTKYKLTLEKQQSFLQNWLKKTQSENYIEIR